MHGRQCTAGCNFDHVIWSMDHGQPCCLVTSYLPVLSSKSYCCMCDVVKVCCKAVHSLCECDPFLVPIIVVNLRKVAWAECQSELVTCAVGSYAKAVYPQHPLRGLDEMPVGSS